jgi:pyridoxamine 5'-phosphate oxidase
MAVDQAGMHDPLAEFALWFDEAVAAGEEQPEAMALATVGPDGSPSVRIVLLRGLSADSIRFFTNFESKKGRDLERSPACSVVFHWGKTGKQVRMEGRAERLSDAEADAYFASRPLGHQVAAWASSQSRPLSSRKELLDRWEELRREFADGPVPRPRSWGGYRIVVSAVELWRKGEHRLHERTRYEKRAGIWIAAELQP